MYRSAIDRYDILSDRVQKKNNKEHLKFTFEGEYKTHKTTYFSSKDKINREIEIRNQKNWFPEAYHKYIKEVDTNEKYLQKLPFHNINDHLKNDLKKAKDVLPVYKI